MPATYEPIASQTLGSDSASATFSNIGGNFTDLIIVCVVNTSENGANGLRMRVGNGSVDTGSNYSTTLVYGNGTSALSERISSSAQMAVGNAAASGSSPAVSVIQIMSYANTSVFKTALNAGALAGDNVARNVNLWRSTSAITNLSFFTTTGNIKSGSTFSLFGVKAA